MYVCLCACVIKPKHPAQVNTAPPLGLQERHLPAKHSICPHPHTEGVASPQGKIYHHYPNIISSLGSGSS